MALAIVRLSDSGGPELMKDRGTLVPCLRQAVDPASDRVQFWTRGPGHWGLHSGSTTYELNDLGQAP